jgi:hypothetical protein
LRWSRDGVEKEEILGRDGIEIARRRDWVEMRLRLGGNSPISINLYQSPSVSINLHPSQQISISHNQSQQFSQSP